MSEAKWFAVHYDSVTQVVSSGFFLVLMAVAFLAHLAVVGVVGALVMILGFAWSPRGYWVSDRSITVKRWAGNVVIPVEGLREIRRAGDEDLRGCVRLWGSGGLFGYYGVFRTSKLGTSTWYVTNRAKMAVAVGPKTALFSPDDVEGFVEAVRAVAPLAAGPAEPGLSVPVQERSELARRALVGVAVLLVAIGLIRGVTGYDPGPPAYTIARGSMTIHDRFYPVTLRAGEIDRAGVRVVSVGKDSEWRPVARTNGFSNGRYSSGWFRVANGQKVRMYRAGAERLVLIPGRGDEAAVLVEAKDPEGMVAEVRRLAGGTGLSR